MRIIKLIGFLFFLILYLLLGFPVKYIPATTFLLLLAYYLPKLFFQNRKQVFKSFERYYFVFFAINILFVLLNSYVSFQKGSIEHPWIFHSDPESYYNMAKNFSNENNLNLNVLSGLYIGYPLLMGLIFKVFGAFLPIDLIFNVMAAGILYVLTLRLGLVFNKNEKNLRLISIFMLISPHILSLGSIFLKDVWIAVGMVGAVLCILYLMEKYKFKYLLGLFLCLIIIGLMRGVYLVIPLLLPLFIAPFKNIRIQFLLVIFIYVVYLVVSELNPFLKNLTKVYDTNVTGEVITNWGTGGVNQLIGGYNDWPYLKKIIFLPVTFLIQFVLPNNFWNLSYDYPWRFLQRTMMGEWILYFLPLIFITILKKGRKLKSNKVIRGVFIWALMSLSISAFLYGGVVPRYGIPFIPFILVVIAYLNTTKNLKNENAFYK